MDEENTRRRLTTFGQAARTERILERLREGASYQRIAYEEELTERRIRQIVAEIVEAREAVEGSTHAKKQIERLGQALKVASEALARGDVKAIGPLLKVMDRLDRYQPFARAPMAQRNSGFDLAAVKSIIGRALELEAEAGAAPPEPEASNPDEEAAHNLPPAEAEA